MYTMKDVCEKVSLPYETLRYYCNEGLIPNVKRDQNNYRLFDDKDVKWIEGLQRLKQCGLSIKELKQYLEYALMGPSSIDERSKLLDEKRKALILQKNLIDQSIAYIDEKQAFYANVLSGKIKYTSNLIKDIHS